MPTPLVSSMIPGNSVSEPLSLPTNVTAPAYFDAVLWNSSWAVTVKLKTVPAVAVAGVLNAKCAVGPALTAIALLAPVMLLVVVSVAVMVWLPAVVKVALKRLRRWSIRCCPAAM